MKKDIARPAIVDESLKAMPSIDSHGTLRQGLANTMAALVSGEISADDGLAIAKAAKKRMKEINRDVLNESSK